MKKKKILTICIVVIAIILVGLFLAFGGKRTDVFLKDFELSQDGKTMKNFPTSLIGKVSK